MSAAWRMPPPFYENASRDSALYGLAGLRYVEYRYTRANLESALYFSKVYETRPHVSSHRNTSSTVILGQTVRVNPRVQETRPCIASQASDTSSAGAPH